MKLSRFPNVAIHKNGDVAVQVEWGTTDRHVTIAAADVPALRRVLKVETRRGLMEALDVLAGARYEPFLTEHSIPYETYTWTSIDW